MNITNKGKLWELKNSLWLIWSCIIVFNWGSFFYIGLKAKKMKWNVFGCIYFFLNFFLAYLAMEMDPTNSTLIYNILMGICVLSNLICIVHAFLSRKEYLIRLEVLSVKKEFDMAEFKQRIVRETKAEFPDIQHRTVSQPQMQSQAPLAAAYETATAAPLKEMLNLNEASEAQLAELPGVGVELAKKAVALRAQNGSFLSVDDFCQQLGLMPQFAVQIDKSTYAVPAVNAPVTASKSSN